MAAAWLMRAIDTNILVRFLVRDHAGQFERASAILTENFLVVPTVLIEAEWVLRAVYDWEKREIAEAFLELAALRQWMNDDPAIFWALERYRQGADLADMIHLGAAVGSDSFATFDLGLEKAAGTSAPVAVETLAV